MALWSPARFPVVIETGFPYAEMISSTGHHCGFHAASQWRPRIWDSFDEPRAEGTAVHRATDIMAPIGAAVVAANDGVILETWRHDGQTLPGVGYSEKGGFFAWVKEDGGFTSYYAHMAYQPVVRPGQRVVAGQRLGAVGNTGNASTTCAHCHFAVTDPVGNKINPYPALKILYDQGAWRIPPKDKSSASMWGLALGTLGLAVFGMLVWDDSRKR